MGYSKRQYLSSTMVTRINKSRRKSECLQHEGTQDRKIRQGEVSPLHASEESLPHTRESAAPFHAVNKLRNTWTSFYVSSSPRLVPQPHPDQKDKASQRSISSNRSLIKPRKHFRRPLRHIHHKSLNEAPWHINLIAGKG